MIEPKISGLRLSSTLHQCKNKASARRQKIAEPINVFRFYKNFNGILTKEDEINVELIKNDIKNLSTNQIKEKLSDIGKQIINLFSQKYGFYKENSKMLFVNPNKSIEKNFYNKLLKLKYLQAALSRVNKQEITVYPLQYRLSIDTVDTDPRKINASENIVTHPIEVAGKLLGYQKFNENYEQNLVEHKNIKDLITLKIKLLAQIDKYNSKESFSNSDKKGLKILVDRYFSIDNYLKKKNIHTDNIERYIFNKINFNEIKKGQFLSGNEIVVDKNTIYNRKSNKEVKTITVFSKTSNDFQLKMYHFSPYKVLDGKNVKAKLNYLLRIGNVEGINSFNKELKMAEVKQQDLIAKLHFRFVNKNILEQEMKPHVLKDTDNLDKSVLIEDFENFNQEKYNYTALKFIAPLRELLTKNDVGRIFIKALSFNNTHHSPAALYLRLGFTPLFKTKEALLEELFNKKRIRENDGIWFEYIMPKT